MDFSAILRKSASSSSTETEKCSSNESLLQAIDSEFERIVHVEETLSQFTFELDRDFNKGCRSYIILTKEFQGELVRVLSGCFYDLHLDFEDLTVTINKHRGSSITFNCSYTPDEISITDITVHDRHQYLKIDLDVDENVDENENLKGVFQKYLEIRGIKPSNIAFIFKCISNNYINLIVLKKIKNFISFSERYATRNKPELTKPKQPPAKTIARQTAKKATQKLPTKPQKRRSTTEGKQQVDQIKNYVQKPRSEFTLKIENSAHEHHVVLTRELRGELVEVRGYIKSFTDGKDGTRFYISISTNGDSFLNFRCLGTSDAISIQRIGIIHSKGLQEGDDNYYDLKFDDMDESLKKAFFEYLEIRGIKPSIVDFMIKCYRYLKAKKNAYGVEEDYELY